jgi:hypothetical protein
MPSQHAASCRCSVYAIAVLSPAGPLAGAGLAGESDRLDECQVAFQSWQSRRAVGGTVATGLPGLERQLTLLKGIRHLCIPHLQEDLCVNHSLLNCAAIVWDNPALLTVRSPTTPYALARWPTKPIQCRQQLDFHHRKISFNYNFAVHNHTASCRCSVYAIARWSPAEPLADEGGRGV